MKDKQTSIQHIRQENVSTTTMVTLVPNYVNDFNLNDLL
jgi:hypothetical protein